MLEEKGRRSEQQHMERLFPAPVLIPQPLDLLAPPPDLLDLVEHQDRRLAGLIGLGAGPHPLCLDPFGPWR